MPPILPSSASASSSLKAKQMVPACGLLLTFYLIVLLVHTLLPRNEGKEGRVVVSSFPEDRENDLLVTKSKANQPQQPHLEGTSSPTIDRTENDIRTTPASEKRKVLCVNVFFRVVIMI